MSKFKVKIEKENIPSFCQKLTRFQSNFDVRSKHREIDGKSILGLHTLDLKEPMEIDCILHNNETLENIKNALKDYIID